MSIEIKNLNYSYNKKETVLNDINLTINKTDKIAIVGKSGAGKSTLLNLLVGILLSEQGEIKIDDFILNKKNLKKNYHKMYQLVNLVLQNASMQLFYPTVREEIASIVQRFSIDEQRVDFLLKRFEIDDTFLDKKIFYLSGGEKRKVTLILAFLQQSEYLLLDEPTIGLDPKSRDEVVEMINFYREEENKCVIICSHDDEFISKTTEKIILVENKTSNLISYKDFLASEYAIKNKRLPINEYYLRIINEQLGEKFTEINQFVKKYQLKKEKNET